MTYLLFTFSFLLLPYNVCTKYTTICHVFHVARLPRPQCVPVVTKLGFSYLCQPHNPFSLHYPGKLANALKNEENPQYAALCFAAMAK